tara:strand:+ start:1594 stop:2013 length:420 start_codon:yes stop_codon:yes gene_type:complete
MTSLEKQVKSSTQERTRGLVLTAPLLAPNATAIDRKNAILALIGAGSMLKDNTSVQSFINKLSEELATAKASSAGSLGDKAKLTLKEQQIKRRDQEIATLKSDHKRDLEAIYDALVGLTDGSSSAREILGNALKKSEGN